MIGHFDHPCVTGEATSYLLCRMCSDLWVRFYFRISRWNSQLWNSTSYLMWWHTWRQTWDSYTWYHSLLFRFQEITRFISPPDTETRIQLLIERVHRQRIGHNPTSFAQHFFLGLVVVRYWKILRTLICQWEHNECTTEQSTHHVCSMWIQRVFQRQYLVWW